MRSFMLISLYLYGLKEFHHCLAIWQVRCYRCSGVKKLWGLVVPLTIFSLSLSLFAFVLFDPLLSFVLFYRTSLLPQITRAVII